MALVNKDSLAQPAAKAQCLFDAVVQAPGAFGTQDLLALVNLVEQVP